MGKHVLTVWLPDFCKLGCVWVEEVARNSRREMNK